MIKTTAAAALMFMSAMVWAPAQASPNECEAIIVEVMEARKEGLITSAEASKIIHRCADATWN